MSDPQIKTYEVGDAVSYHYLIGRPIKGTVVERFEIKGEAYKRGLKHYPELQEGEYGYMVADSGGTVRNFTRFDIEGKFQNGKLERNPAYQAHKKTTVNAGTKGPKAKGYTCG